jgi:hypothetical protein
MKIQRKFFEVLILSGAIIFMTACSGDKKESADVTDTVTAKEAEKHEHEMDVTQNEEGKPQFTVDQMFQSQLTTVFKDYVELKEAFVSSDASKVKSEAKKTRETLGKVDMKLVSGPAHNDWMVYQGELQAGLDKIASSSDIEDQRETFSKVSYSLYKTIKAYGLAENTAYYEFCPMAFNNKGAYWLSDNSKIRNPYFGDKMLTCGSVEETLK